MLRYKHMGTRCNLIKWLESVFSLRHKLKEKNKEGRKGDRGGGSSLTRNSWGGAVFMLWLLQVGGQTGGFSSCELNTAASPHVHVLEISLECLLPPKLKKISRRSLWCRVNSPNSFCLLFARKKWTKIRFVDFFWTPYVAFCGNFAFIDTSLWRQLKEFLQTPEEFFFFFYYKIKFYFYDLVKLTIVLAYILQITPILITANGKTIC